MMAVAALCLTSLERGRNTRFERPTMEKKRYLPIIRPDGSWIDRPDLFLLARMGYEDNADEQVVHQLHDAMVRADNTVPSLNAFEQDIAKRHLNRELRLRLFAGQTLLELVRIARTNNEPPSAAQGIRLAAFNQHRAKGRSSADDLKREVRKGFTAFRGTAHLQAAMVLADPSVGDIETSEDHLIRYLARARGLEIFIDNYVVSKSFKWNPWRVPACIDPNFYININRLTHQEQGVITSD
ncbi:hypothetical protein [Gemmobacter nectariphilus]|uniref:hypothetical protein n=1 Tax=Gemmobacter nectariphilus TaxID=220343 RepID=UPI001377A52E|nr:hypothetical protein [Gemmobacter nectariphilus]